MLRGQIADIVAGSIFVFLGAASCAIAAIRRQSGAGVFVWLGTWSAMYGAMRFTDSRAVLAASPVWMRASAPYVSVSFAYLLLIPALLAFAALTCGALRLLVRGAALLGLVIGAIGVTVFVVTGSRDELMPFNNLLVRCILVVLAIVIVMPRLASRYFVFGDRGEDRFHQRAAPRRVLMVGMFVFAVEAFFANTARPLGFTPQPLLDHLGFAVLLFSLAYVALELVLATERRLLAVDHELDVARAIQIATLPREVPTVRGLRISASYRPMTAVAGDFYTFIRGDADHIGILVADATGHGIPAALIASMIKVAAHAVSPIADNPAAVLAGLNRMLSGQSPGQLISAAYLWMDVEHRIARYAAAGHPPLLRWAQGRLERIESNGFLLGMVEESVYRATDITLTSGDRFLLYTDGIIEVENADGGFFGDNALEETILAYERQAPGELSEALLSAVDRWRPRWAPQQDDMTLVVVDVA